MAEQKRRGRTPKATGGRGHAIRVYVDPDQHATIQRKAKKAGLTASSYLLMAGLERPERTD